MIRLVRHLEEVEQVGHVPSTSLLVLKDRKLTEAVVSRTVLDLREPIVLLLSCPSQYWPNRNWKEAFSALKELCKELDFDRRISLSDLSGYPALQAKKEAVEILRTNRQIFACLDHSPKAGWFEVGNGGHLRAGEFPTSMFEESRSWPETRNLLELGRGGVFVPVMACETLRSGTLEQLVEKSWVPFKGRGKKVDALQGFIWCNSLFLVLKGYLSNGEERPLLRDVLRLIDRIHNKFYGYWAGIGRATRCRLILASGTKLFQPGTSPLSPQLIPLSKAAKRVIQCPSPSREDFATFVDAVISPLLGEVDCRLDWSPGEPQIRLFEDETLYVDVPQRIRRVLWPIFRSNPIVWVTNWSDCLLAKQEIGKLRKLGNQDQLVLYIEEQDKRKLEKIAGDLLQTAVLEIRSASELRMPPAAFVSWGHDIERWKGLKPVGKKSPLSLLYQLADRGWITVLH